MTKKEDGYSTDDDWYGLDDFLGQEAKTWTAEKVQKTFRGLYETQLKFLDQSPGSAAFLELCLYQNGLTTHPKWKNYFTDLHKKVKTPNGLEELKKLAYGESGFEPTQVVDEESEVEKNIEELQKIFDKTLTPEQATKYSEGSLALPYQPYESVRNILKQTKLPDSLIDHFDQIQFFISFSIKKLWNRAFIDEQGTVSDVQKEGLDGNEYHDEVVQTFLKEYELVNKIKISKHWIAKQIPYLMQRYIAFKIKKEKYFGNFSEPGSGKTLSGLLASRLINSKLTLILCTNNIVGQWEKNIKKTFDDVTCITKQDCFSAKYDSQKHQYLILNYDQLNQPNSKRLVKKLGRQKIDFVILDEFQHVKRRNEESWRRENMRTLLVQAKKTNPDLRVLGLSATPVINELEEGISLLELILGKEMSDKLSPRHTIPNALILYSYITNHSIRQKKGFDIEDPLVKSAEVEAPVPDPSTLERCNKSRLSAEQFLTDARIPEIIKRIDGPTIIYTDNVGTTLSDQPQIIHKLENALRENNKTFGRYVGGDDSGYESFKNGEIDVLIGSLPISVGVDELQYRCSNLIFNTLPYTFASYQQIVGRIYRDGQKNPVKIHIIKASMGGIPYDQRRLDAIDYKRQLSDCAVDGRIPFGDLTSIEKARKELFKLLQKISSGEISRIPEKELSADLTPEEEEIILNPKRRLSELSTMHMRMNTMSSKKLVNEYFKNRDVFIRYHKIYRAEYKEWPVKPDQEIIQKIKLLADNLKIADFGCGDARIADAFPGRVKSFDIHVIEDPTKITQCDVTNVEQMRKHIPDWERNIVVICLALHSTNWRDYVKEAARCLPKGGQIFIAETTSKLLKTQKGELPSVLEQNGFKIDEQYTKGSFTFIEARKI